MTSTPKQMTTTTEAESGERIDPELAELVELADSQGYTRGMNDMTRWSFQDSQKYPVRERQKADIAASITRRLAPPSIKPSPADDRGMDIIRTAIEKHLGDWYGETFGPDHPALCLVLATIRREWELQGIALTEVN